MLKELRVTHFAIIQDLKLCFKDGLNILSGETGAGKSVLLKSLGLLMGDKATLDLVSDCSDTASVEGLFDLRDRPDTLDRLKELDLPLDQSQLIVRRILSKEGTSRVYLNGSLTTLQVLREVICPLVEVPQPIAPLIEMTGQHESKNLMSKSYHLDILDKYCESSSLRGQYEASYKEWLKILNEMERLQLDGQDRDQRLDYLRFQFQQINDLNLQPGEDEVVQGELKILKSTAKMQELAQTCDDVLIQDEDSAHVRLQRSAQLCNQLGKVNALGIQWGEDLRNLASQLEDCVFKIRSYTESLESAPHRILELEERLSIIRTLQKRYGTSIEVILSQKEALAREITDLESLEDRLKVCEKRSVEIQLVMKNLGERLTTLRKKGSKKLANAVNGELEELNMKGVSLIVSVDSTDVAHPTGYDEVELLLKSSTRAEPKPLRKVASGGELSRVLLALKSVGGDSGAPRTYLFDEVDSGVSGLTAQKVGKKLYEIARGQQVICITHLPQVAAFADHHFFISKALKDGLASMTVKALDKDSRTQELARLLSGEAITPTALKNAKELMHSSRQM